MCTNLCRAKPSLQVLTTAALTAHALHPNYPEKHDPALQPTLGGGMVIKTNLEQRYATSAVSGEDSYCGTRHVSNARDLDGAARYPEST